MQKVLSIDGGGIRGIIPAMVLTEIETRTGKATSELFDLVAGTSTGGILALGLTKPEQDGAPEYSAERLIELYETEGDNRRYYRVQTVLDTGKDDMDDANATNIKALKTKAKEIIDENDAALDALCTQLVA